VSWGGAARRRRRLARPAVVRQPWPVAAVPDAPPAGGAVRVVPGALAVAAAPPVPPTVVLPDAASARTDVAGLPVAASPDAPRPLIVLRPVAGSGPSRAPIRRGHVPGTPVRAPRPLWGPPRPAS
jgi:hypothetical protein